jgi:hypothetical protein
MKFIKNLICKIFHIKACQCREEMDEHIEYFTKVPEPDTPVHYEEQQLHCGLHTRFRRSCPECVATQA